ncbi:YD repeat-containing protein [Burkholderia sp. GAS332]|nr:YD repeat-containing protein [Burkholderia sp. GAS332]
MNRNHSSHGPAVCLVRFLAAFALLMMAFGANADNGCWELYSKSGATPGTPSCRLDVASNTPSGMGSYGCRNNLDLIDAWCAAGSSEPEDSCPVADPVYPSSGVVTLTENDFVSGDELPVTFARTYRSTVFLNGASVVGPMWFHNWQRQLNVTGATGSYGNVVAYRSNGEPLSFTWTNGVWRTKSFSGLTLVQNGTGWMLQDLLTETTESYSAQGVFLSESTKTGFDRILSYDASGRLTTIKQHAANTDATSDLTLRLEYDDKGRIARLVDPIGGITQYRYDTNSNLTAVIWPDGNVRQYVYGDSRFKNAITGIVDETGSRIATWTYDANGRAAAVSHPDTTHNVQFVYGTGTTTVTNTNGARTLSFSTIGGKVRPTGSSGSLTSAFAWDAAGNLLGTSTSGRNATYSYDDTGRPITATVRTASAVTVTSVQYADLNSLHPSMIAMPNKVQAFVYDANGNVTGFSELSTDDATGERGFNAKSSGWQMTIGARYDASNRMVAALKYINGQKVADWSYRYDRTGNLGNASNRTLPWTLGVANRDAAHRATYLPGDNREVLVTYDLRGRVSEFKYFEFPTELNGRQYRNLSVNYGYSGDGRVVSRTGAVARYDGGPTGMSPPESISSDEIDKWLDNYESGANLVGPLANILARLTPGDSDPGPRINAVCVDCGFMQARLAWSVFLHDLYFNAQTGKPVEDDPVEIQVAAQNQLPFPVLTPNLSQRSALYAKVFPSAAAQTSGFVKCKDDSDCGAVRTACRKKCSFSALPTGDFGVKFWNCVNDCAELSGCPRI